MRPRLLALVVAVMIAALSSASLAAAEGKSTGDKESEQRAADLKKKGDAAMDSLHYQDALTAYDEAYALNHDPAILFNRGRALQALGEFPQALEQLERFSAEAPAALKSKVP